MLHGRGLGKFNELALAGNLNANYLNHIKKGLLEYFPPINEHSKQKGVMRREMCKPHDMIFKSFTAELKEIINFLPLFHGSYATNNIPPEEINEILLHAVPNGWSKQDYLQGWDFEMKTFR